MKDGIIKSPILVVGAGITGLVIAYELVKKDLPVIVLEKEDEIGGLAKTVNFNGNNFDIGPHRFYSSNEKIIDYIRQILDGSLKKIKRHSLIYCQGRYFNWPLSFIDIFNLHLKTLLSITGDFISNIRAASAVPKTNYEDYIKTGYGKTMYEIFFKNLSDKFLSYPANKIHWTWAKTGIEKAVIDEKIYSRNLEDIAWMLFKLKKYASNYFYPVNGIGMFTDTLASLIIKEGGVIKTGEEIIDIDFDDGEPAKVALKSGVIVPSQIIWTAPITNLAKVINCEEPRLVYHTLQLFFFSFKERDLLKKFQWCYYSDKDVSFHRVSMPSCFSRELAISGTSSVVIERSYDEDENHNNNSLELKDKMLYDLKKARVIKKTAQPQDILIKKIDNAYPVYNLGFMEEKDKFFNYLKKFENIKLVGRQGLFWYNSMDECIENALKVAEEVALLF